MGIHFLKLRSMTHAASLSVSITFKKTLLFYIEYDSYDGQVQNALAFMLYSCNG